MQAASRAVPHSVNNRPGDPLAATSGFFNNNPYLRPTRERAYSIQALVPVLYNRFVLSTTCPSCRWLPPPRERCWQP